MTTLAWPLATNHIRRGVSNNAFGMVRNGGTRAHQGWDLYARPLTECFAVADGVIVDTRRSASYGNVVVLKFEHQGGTLYAHYCHLSLWFVERRQHVKRGQVIALTGNTGNARSMRGEDQHLHFEIRTIAAGHPEGLAGRIDPALLYGRAPIGWTFFQSSQEKAAQAGPMGLKVPGINMQEVAP